MRIGDATDYLELEVLEVLPPGLPSPGDVRVQATLRLRDFSGSFTEVWIEKPELERFTADLARFVESGSGEVRLQAMSPEELTLVLRWTDALRVSEGCADCSVEAHLGRYQYSGETPFQATLSGGFELDSAQLPALLSWFAAH